eukprot:TRINITY_DN839_c0_g1_i15.p3 TRINITY_DN839_c0_g1~~TRINITY_DN839_c0_g1_i15.p3  ORF type:complete len:161 (-),score=36.48 TRINITY_DN839_c0_g1_i15:1247-1729(-)
MQRTNIKVSSGINAEYGDSRRMQRQQQYQYPTHSRYHNHNHPPRLHYAHDHHQLQQTTLKQPILVRYFSTNTQPLKPRRRYTRWILISSLGVGVGCYVIFKNLCILFLINLTFSFSYNLFAGEVPSAQIPPSGNVSMQAEITTLKYLNHFLRRSIYWLLI